MKIWPPLVPLLAGAFVLKGQDDWKLFIFMHIVISALPMLFRLAFNQMVEQASKWKQPAMALTDHGVMSGTVQLYKAGKKRCVQVFPGFGGYVVEDHTDATAQRYHSGVLATTLRGFRAISRFNSLAHTRPRYNRFPRHDLADLADLAS